MAAGEFGVDRMLTLFREEYVRTLALLGLTSTAQLDTDAVVLPEPVAR